MKRLLGLIVLTLMAVVWWQSLRATDANSTSVTQQGGQLEYLGEGGTFEIGPGESFIVKRLQPFSFETVPGPTFTATNRERVWRTTGSAPPAHFKTTIDLGNVPASCLISFQAIDDDVDSRINTFFLNGKAVYDMPQGMVTGGEFVTDSAGRLTFEANDSIGIWLSRCPTPPDTPTPTATETPTTAPTVTPTPLSPEVTETATPGPSATPTVTPTGTLLPSPTNTPTATAEATSTATATPAEATATPAEATATSEPGQPTVTATPTKKPRLLACLRINFEVGGDVARAGRYEVKELGGRLLYVWIAQEGWTDSGWVHGIDISHESVYVRVFYVPADGSPPIEMKIVNPAPGTSYGWLSRGMCHAIEVAWPDQPPPQAAPSGEDAPQEAPAPGEEIIIWPGQEPTATPTPSRKLRG